MNFREYYDLHEDLNYILMKNRYGQYQVIGPKSTKELPQAVQQAKHANNPAGIWTYNTTGGQIHLPNELQHDIEPILQAHYRRMGLDRPEQPPESPSEKQAVGDVIDPDVFDPEYEKHHAQWKQYQGQQQMQQQQRNPFIKKSEPQSPTIAT